MAAAGLGQDGQGAREGLTQWAFHQLRSLPRAPPSTIQTWRGRKRNRSGPFRLQQCCARTRGPTRRAAVRPEKTYGVGKSTTMRLIVGWHRHHRDQDRVGWLRIRRVRVRLSAAGRNGEHPRDRDQVNLNSLGSGGTLASIRSSAAHRCPARTSSPVMAGMYIPGDSLLGHMGVQVPRDTSPRVR